VCGGFWPSDLLSDPARADCWANKGVIYARIQVGDRKDEYIHVFNTHMQAHRTDEDKKIRAFQLEELQAFIEKATEFDYGSHPIIILGDLNIDAHTDEYAVLGQKLEVPQDPIDILLDGKQGFEDLWMTMRPKEQPDYTWVGSDYTPPEGEKCPYGKKNTLAEEKGKGERIDYILCHSGTGNVVLVSKSMSLVPSSPIDPPYCLDEKTRIDLGFSVSTDVDDDPFTLYALVWSCSHDDCRWGDSATNRLREELKKHGITLHRDARFSFADETGGYETAYIDNQIKGERLVLRCECSGWGSNDPCRLNVYMDLYTSVACISTSDCALNSFTVSDHLGLELYADIVFP